MKTDGQGAVVLLVEDHPDIAESVAEYLESCGYAIDHAADGVTGLHLAVTNHYQAIVVDVMLPGLDGVSLCRRLREDARRDTPLLMLTARDTLDDKLAGLEAGADDYLVKPFEIRELEARIRTLLRRQRGAVVAETLRIADLELDLATMQVARGGQPIRLMPIGLRLLTVLMRASPRVVSRRQLEREVWGDVLPDSDTLRSHLYALRKAIDKPFARPLLHTIPGIGYRLAICDAA
jgi:DNA-binding response OmpR family regulator